MPLQVFFAVIPVRAEKLSCREEVFSEVVDSEVVDSDPEHEVTAKHTMRAVPTNTALGTRLPARLSLPSIRDLSLCAIRFFGHSRECRIAGVPG